MLLATKLKNRILLAAKPEDLPLKIELKNIIVNGVKRGCSGFVTKVVGLLREGTGIMR